MTEDEDLGKRIEEVRREVIEARNLTIKGDNAIKVLHAEVKAIGGRQDAFRRRAMVSTATAYVVFALLCAAGAIGVIAARAQVTAGERTRSEKQLSEMTVAMDRYRAAASERAQIEKTAVEAYQQMTEQKGEARMQGVALQRRLESNKLSALEKLVLTGTARPIEKEVRNAALERAKVAMWNRDWNGAIAAAKVAQATNPAGEEAAQVSFALGNAYFRARQYDQAIGPLSDFVALAGKSWLHDAAAFMLVQSLDATGQVAEGSAAARKGLEAASDADFKAKFLDRVRRIGGAAVAAP